VLFATDAPGSDPAHDTQALLDVGQKVSESISRRMARIAQFERPPSDAGQSDDGGADAAPTGEGGASDGPPPTSIAIADFPGAAADAWCGRVYECCSPDDRLGGTLTGGSQAECRFQVATALTVAFSAARDEADAGRVTYDPGAAATCLADLRAGSCDALRARAAELPCKGALHPAVAVGGACASTLDCVDGFCQTPAEPVDAGAAAGVCVAHGEVGAACDADDACASGFCAGGQCAARDAPRWCHGL
jgi:hypothetical protein